MIKQQCTQHSIQWQHPIKHQQHYWLFGNNQLLIELQFIFT